MMMMKLKEGRGQGEGEHHFGEHHFYIFPFKPNTGDRIKGYTYVTQIKGELVRKYSVTKRV